MGETIVLGGLELNGLLGWAVLLSPYVMLGFSIMHMVRRPPHAEQPAISRPPTYRSFASKAYTIPTEPSRPGSARTHEWSAATEAKPVATAGGDTVAASSRPSLSTPSNQVQLGPASGGSVVQTATTAAGPAGGRTEVTPGDSKQQQGRPEAHSEEHAQAETWLAIARRRMASGRASEAEELLNRCVRTAARVGLPVLNARARLELGELACEAGNFNAACEHWQIAFLDFSRHGHTAEAQTVERRMHKIECPLPQVAHN